MTSVAVVGAGPNGLSAACRLAQAGLNVTVYERSSVAGGSCRSVDLFGNGSVVDLGAAAHPFGVASPAFKTLKLEAHGLEWIHPKYPMAHPFAGEPAALLHQDIEATAQYLGRDYINWKNLHAPFSNYPEGIGLNLMNPLLKWPNNPILMAKFGAKAIWSAKSVANTFFHSEQARALFAGSSLHSTLPPSYISTSAFGIVFGVLGMTTGWPVAKGGSQSIINALLEVLHLSGGRVQYNSEILNIRDISDNDIIVFDLVPSRILGIEGIEISEQYKRQLKKWRHKSGVYKVDYLLDGPIPWEDSRVNQAGTVHVGGSLEEMNNAEKTVAKGKVPSNPFVMLAQQQNADLSRSARNGENIIWTYAHVPNGCSQDIRPLIEGQIERFAPGFRERIITAVEHTPHDLERWNPNLIGGDIGGGALDGTQQIFRPIAGRQPYRLLKNRIYICSSSTPPGGGVHGMGGWHAAEAVLTDLLR
ncbi:MULTISPECIES: phytoene desaturase family protein [Rothia]|uniref:phytoene desaturase family protein n=1 Tax=Rothia TaxID=32207 RepID=UPI0009F72782|nr:MULTISPECIES: NAD(P)/FAD-dependent oxidoreductase [Rothia]